MSSAVKRCTRRSVVSRSAERAPFATWRSLSTGFCIARHLEQGALSLAELERLIGRLFLSDSRRGDAGTPRGIRYPPTDVLSLAEDVDTAEEAASLDLSD